MRVTFVLPFINLTGGIRVMFDYANWMHDAGHQVAVVYPAWPYQFGDTRAQQWGEFRKHLKHDGQVPWYPLRCSLLRVPLIRSWFLPRADVVIAAGSAVALDVARASRSKGRQVLIVFHDETGPSADHREAGVHRLPFYRIAFSQFVRTSIEAHFGCRIDAVVPNGVDTGVFFPDAVPEPKSVLFLYHPDPRKGAADGIEALTRLRARMPDVRVNVCGTVRPGSLPAWMTFSFHPPDDVLRRHYSTAGVFLYPSRYEGFGLPPLEAMACGCPVVTTAVGAVPEYATDGLNASVVPVGDVDAMVDRLARLLEDGTLRERFREQGLLTARRFALREVAPLFAEAIQKAGRM